MKEINDKVKDLKRHLANLEGNVTNAINSKLHLMDLEVRELGLNAYLHQQVELIRTGLSTIRKLASGSTNLGKLEEPDIALPLFTYGAFKPGQLAFTQLKRFIDSERPPELVSARGRLLVRDGLPLFAPGSDLIEGYVLHFAKKDRGEAYNVVRTFEPAEIYEWANLDVDSTRALRGNVLLGKFLDQGNPAQLNKNSWTFSDDPVFKEGLAEVAAIIGEDCDHPVPEEQKRSFEWPRFFRLQMAYLLLWSAVQRFTCFAYSPRLNDEDRNTRLSADHRFKEALLEVQPQVRVVSKSLRPEKVCTLNPESPKDAVDYYYQIRCNLSHRGKAHYIDLETLDSSLCELYQILCRILDATKLEERRLSGMCHAC
jgi:hypothetical protein